MKRSIEWEVRAGFCLYLALMLLLLPLRWLFAALIAGALHELGHLFALKCLKLPVKAVHLEAGGAKIVTYPCSEKQELISAAAGPAAGFLTCLLFPVFPRLAFCACLQAVFNLLPLMPFDGGRVLRCTAALLLGKDRGARFFAVLEYSFCFLLLLAGILTVRISWLLPAACALIILRCAKNRKT